MKKRTKEKLKSWSVATVILFMAFMLVIAYMPGLFVPDRSREEEQSFQEQVDDYVQGRNSTSSVGDSNNSGSPSPAPVQ